MPEDFTTVQHYRQSKPGACLQACARMVLAALGDDFSEERLAAQLGSYEFGTPASRITRLRRWGYRVEFGPATIDDLRTQLELGWYPIVLLLAWEEFDCLAAVISK